MIKENITITQLEELRNLIRRYDHHYYGLDNPLVPDAEYDRCYKSLVDLENQYPALKTPDSPTMRVGFSPVSVLETIEHGAQMLSLNNVFSAHEFSQFTQRLAEKVTHS